MYLKIILFYFIIFVLIKNYLFNIIFMGDTMLGKIINYNAYQNKITITFEKQNLNIIFINEDIVRFFIN